MKATGFCTFYYTQQGVAILARKNSLFMNWYSFLGHEYSFTPPALCPRHQAAITIALQLLFPLNKTKSSLTKQTLVKVLG